ncbi:2OG-Fe(II) oxygenase [Okeania sp. KiyG1]|uniref:2OG-Fe(II) oxygenase n=1 Tax=Okeania sp. KiyG1 TaxID=2720165 RepID=UPI0019244310|nr:2OG-Fe(II) oxygenase [Okeania sp. KiyG1]GGA11530.1 hypothetical protein CYANOKiyG1_24480 [Okeania sp. KiyG1]GGA18520.1 hypothetical protein CYANOKiyG1_33010 [Okeania sp. KiyG1]
MEQKWITTDINSLGNYSDGINQIYQGNIDGIHIKQVFSLTEMEVVKENLTQKQASFKHLLSTQKYGKLLGAILPASGNDRSEYFQDAVLLRKVLKEVFEPPGYEATIKSVFTKLSNNRKVAPAHQNGNIYSPALVRFTYPNQGGISLHKGNEFIDMEGFEGLHKIVKLKDCLSYFLVIDPPEAGGELILYDGLPAELTTPKKELDLENCQQRRYHPQAGDLTIFHGACIWHAISEVKGNKIRYSIGGFVGLSHEDDTIYYWA